MRNNNRENSSLRKVSFIPNYLKSVPGSVLVSFGGTRIICTATLEKKPPRWMQSNDKRGWITAEYNMLPRSSSKRIRRERGANLGGRTQEIQRLISRSLRAAVDLKILGSCTITIDCDVIEADGGTRTASISGAYISLAYLIKDMLKKNMIKQNPIKGNIAAVSVGKVKGELLCDLDYSEDSTAEADVNIVALADDKIIEIQATGEEGYLSTEELMKLTELGLSAVRSIYPLQNKCLQEMIVSNGLAKLKF